MEKWVEQTAAVRVGRVAVLAVPKIRSTCMVVMVAAVALLLLTVPNFPQTAQIQQAWSKRDMMVAKLMGHPVRAAGKMQPAAATTAQVAFIIAATKACSSSSSSSNIGGPGLLILGMGKVSNKPLNMEGKVGVLAPPAPPPLCQPMASIWRVSSVVKTEGTTLPLPRPALPRPAPMPCTPPALNLVRIIPSVAIAAYAHHHGFLLACVMEQTAACAHCWARAATAEVLTSCHCITSASPAV
mmetsp:Transcript_28030/g.75712  ORF Transcript_28030/g.75712 Transcript_28030/m.75712 type:complete len:241 (+) Transcript_28030:1853-2575(+)